MSGITPLLDTLLHQVLGKRADIPPPRDLNEPVRPVDPGEGPRALHSDSRLEGRRPAGTPLTELTPTPRRSEGVGTQVPMTDTARSSSFQTHFSPSARTIADLLLRFPAPPSVLSSQAPLMRADESPSAAMLADRLQGSVRDSGLFYESHLARWYRGELVRQQLEREPQMWRTLRFTPAAASSAAQSPVAQPRPSITVGPGPAGTQLSNSPSPPPGSSQVLAPPLLAAKSGAAQAAGSYAATGALLPSRPAAPGEAPVASQETALRANAPRESAVPVNRSPAAGVEAAGAGRERADPAPPVQRGGTAEPVHESLQGLVRHQLEMLVAPVLRWEGDVWSGIFMALMVQVPAAAQREGEGGQEHAHGEESEEQTWHSELRLDVPRLGEVQVALWLRDDAVRLELRASDAAALDALRDGVPQLRERLQAAGLGDVLIDTRRTGGSGTDG